MLASALGGHWFGVVDRPLFTPWTLLLAGVPHVAMVAVLSVLPYDNLYSVNVRSLRWLCGSLIIYSLVMVNVSWRTGIRTQDAATGIMTAFLVLRVVDLLFYDPGYPRRLIHVSSLPSKPDPDGLAPPTSTASSTYLQEPVPPPLTLSRVIWAFELWGTWRGIGWNWQAPLTKAASEHPYRLQSTRRHFLQQRISKLVQVLLWVDLYATYMDENTAARAYFSALPGISPRLADQPWYIRGAWSICVVSMVWQSIELPCCLSSISLVSIGGIFKLKGALFEPWGWPPLLGSFGELWKHPGLNTVWARTWHAYFRRVLYALGWIGIGESLIGLPSSSTAPPASTSSTPKDGPSTSQPSPTQRPKPRRSMKELGSNFIKSLIVFTITGLLHEAGNLSLELPEAVHPYVSQLYFPIGSTVLFFAAQPFAIALEAVVKSLYRHHKHKQIQHAASSPFRTFAERLIGFVWTWVWLGWSASWVVEDWSKRGYYTQPQASMSLIRGVWKGQWLIQQP